MNAEVLQLFRQAGGTVSVSEDAILTYTDNFDPAKFAKLIIQECADTILKVLEDDRMKKTMDPEMMKFMKNIGGHYSIFLRGHFGLE